jgi:putative phosphoesterase
VRRVAALYDIHGNAPALEAVLEDLSREGIEAIVVGGDVLPGPMPMEALSRLMDQEIPVYFVQGNGEREALAIREGQAPAEVPASAIDCLRWSGAQLSERQAGLLQSWPKTIELELHQHGSVLFCHATPRSDHEIFTRSTPVEALHAVFQDVGVDVVVCGHTHMQFDRIVSGVRVVNAGSVGMPFGEPRACWLLLGADIQLRRTSYDLEAAAERIRASGYPEAEEFAARYVLQPPGEEEMVTLFERAATRARQ